MKIENDNIDELMFRLLEGEIVGEERTMLLQAIAADKKYSAMWSAWQKTVLNPNDELLVMNTGKLKKKHRSILVIWRQAAVIALAVGIGLWFYMAGNNPQKTFSDTVKPGQPKHRIITVPQPSQSGKSNETPDTVLSLKQKIESIAEVKKIKSLPQKSVKSDQQDVNPKEQAPQLIANEQPHEVIKAPVLEKEEKITLPEPARPVSDGVYVSVVSESKMKNNKTNINALISEKRNLLTRVFSKPKLKVINDSSSNANRKIILENKQYKIMAGF